MPVTIRMTMARFAQAATARRPGFVAAVEQLATRDGDMILIAVDHWHQLTLDHLLAGPLHIPLEPAQLAARTSICAGCEWSAQRDGLAQCDYPERRCARIFPFSPREDCPAGKWPPLPPP